MQAAGNIALREAIESGTVNFSHVLEVDWESDGSFAHSHSDLSRAVVSASTDQRLSGALPADYTLVTGTATSDLSVELSGYVGEDDTPVSVVFSPYNPKSPIYTLDIKGKPVRYGLRVETDEGSVLLRQFTGKIRRASSAVGEHTVSLSALGTTEALLGPAQLPPFATPRFGGIYYDYNSHWVIDQLLRDQGFSYTPLEREDVSFFCSLHGGAIPSHGWNYYEGYSTTGTAPGWWRWITPTPGEGMGVQGDSDYIYSLGCLTGPDNLPRPDPGHTVGISWRMYGKPDFGDGPQPGITQYLNGAGYIYPGQNIPDSDLYQTAYMTALYDDDGLTLRLYNHYDTATLTEELRFTHTLPADDQWNWLQAEVDFRDRDMIVRCWINGEVSEQVVGVPFGTYHRPPPYPDYPAIEWPLDTLIQTRDPISDVQVYHGDTSTTANRYVLPADFVPTSHLEEGLNSLTHNAPEAEGKSAWDVLRDVVNAELGSLYADEYGVIRFTNRESSQAAKTDEDRRIDGTSLYGVSIENATDNVYNVITGSVRPMYQSGRPTTVWDANEDPDAEAVTDSYTFQGHGDPNAPSEHNEVSGFSISIGDMVKPSTIGRNLIPFVTDEYEGQWLWPDKHGYSLPAMGWFGVIADTDDWVNDGNSVTFDLWLRGKTDVDVKVFNFNAFAVQTANGTIDRNYTKGSQGPGGVPRRYHLRIAGHPRLWDLERKFSVRDGVSIDRFQERTMELPRNPWHQSYDSVVAVAEKVLQESRNPVPMMDSVPTTGDPRVQLGDTVRIVDPFVIGADMKAVVSGITRTASASDGVRDEYVLRLVAPPAHWVLGDAIYSVLGESTILS